MAKIKRSLRVDDIDFIKRQKLFFIASVSVAEVNLSPKGYDCLRVIDDKTLLFMAYPGSGNRTARDVRQGGEITIVFTAFEGKPKILRLFCKGELIKKDDSEFEQLFSLFDEKADFVRRLIRLNIYAVEVSCGFGVPKFDFICNRTEQKAWLRQMAKDGKLQRYIEDHKHPVDLKSLKGI